MKNILCITFPRNGHHFLVDCLLKNYMGDELHYCEYYGHCQQIPCTRPYNNFQKRHDETLRLPKNPDLSYIIQYRHPLPSIVSNYEPCLQYGWNNEVPEDTAEQWYLFANRKLALWQGFVHKWIFNNSCPDTFLLPYHELVENTGDTLYQLIKFLIPCAAPDKSRIDELIERFDIDYRRDLSAFRYFNLHQFMSIEAAVANELEKINIPRIYS